MRDERHHLFGGQVEGHVAEPALYLLPLRATQLVPDPQVIGETAVQDGDEDDRRLRAFAGLRDLLENEDIPILWIHGSELEELPQLVHHEKQAAVPLLPYRIGRFLNQSRESGTRCRPR